MNPNEQPAMPNPAPMGPAPAPAPAAPASDPYAPQQPVAPQPVVPGSNGKKSNTGLIVGIILGSIVLIGAIVVIVLFATGVLGGDTNNAKKDDDTSKVTDDKKDDDKPSEKNDDDDDDEKVATGNAQAILSNQKNFFVKIDGKKYYIGDKISTLTKAGYKLNEKAAAETAPAGKYLILFGGSTLKNEDTKGTLGFTAMNPTKSDVLVKDAYIGALAIEKAFDKEAHAENSKMEIYGGLKLGSTKKEVEEIFGKCDNTYEGSSIITWEYKSDESVWRYIKFTFDTKTGEVTEIRVQDYTYLEN